MDVKKPTIVCLCGSTRFKSAYEQANRMETIEGRIVLSVGMFSHADGWNLSEETKKKLDDLHLCKIDLADEILVINPTCDLCPGCGKPCLQISNLCAKRISECCGVLTRKDTYIGDSTRREIAYAEGNGKLVRYLNPPKE